MRFARCAVAVGQMHNKSYVNLGGVAMGIAGSYCDADFMQKYLGLRAEWVDLTEVLRRIHIGIYDHAEYEKALDWVRKNCPEGHPTQNDGKEFASIITDSRAIHFGRTMGIHSEIQFDLSGYHAWQSEVGGNGLA